MGIATFKTYMKCKLGQPSLESLWQLNPHTVPSGSLELSLNLERYLKQLFLNYNILTFIFMCYQLLNFLN